MVLGKRVWKELEYQRVPKGVGCSSCVIEVGNRTSVTGERLSKGQNCRNTRIGRIQGLVPVGCMREELD